MKFLRSHFAHLWIAVGLAVFMWLPGVPRAAAQGGDNTINGQLLDVVGKPWIGITIQSVSDQGQKIETKSAKDGEFTFRNLRAGKYTLYIMLPPGPDGTPNKPYEYLVEIGGGAQEGAKLIINFKDIVAKQKRDVAAEEKAKNDQDEKFKNMKTHFDAGSTLLDQVKQVKTQLATAPADQRPALKQQVTDLSGKAVIELEASKQAAGDKDGNLHLIWARLADAYDGAGRTDDAVNAYKQAIALRPTFVYYNNLGGILGRTGKVEDALAAYEKAAELDPASAAQAWRNAGITLFNAGRAKEAVAPLKKATELDPKNAQAWYLLGAALVGSMEFKQSGDKVEPIVQPGTVEAYQKAEDLDPNGPWGQQAKEGIEQLKAMAPGIQTRIKRN